MPLLREVPMLQIAGEELIEGAVEVEAEKEGVKMEMKMKRRKKRKEQVAIQEAGVEEEVVGSLEDIALDM